MRREELVVRREAEGAVVVLRLPGGTLTDRAAAEFVDACTELAEDRAVRVVVVRHAAADFCSGPGGDLHPTGFPVDPAAALARLRPPVVATLAGRCESVGLEIALAADVRLAHPTATFAVPDLAEGRLPCWGGTQRLPRAVGTALATRVLLLGERLDAAAAQRSGLLYRVADDLDAALREVIGQLLGAAPLALELAKEAVHRGSELPLRDGLRLEGDLNHLLQVTDDRAEGLAAFFGKRPPDFAGR